MRSPFQTIKATKKQHYLSEWITITDIMPDLKTCVTKSGTLVQVVKLKGVDLAAMSIAQREALFYNRKAFFDRIDDDIRISVFACRRKYQEDKHLPDYGQKYAQEIAEIVAQDYKTSFRTEIYIVIKKQIQGINNLTGLGSKHFSKEQGVLLGRANNFSSQVEVIKASLKEFKPEQLTHNDEYSELVAFWNYLLNGGTLAETTTRNKNSLNQVLGYTDIEFIPKEPTGIYKAIKGLFKTYKADRSLQDEVINLVSSEVSKGNNSYIRFAHSKASRVGSILFLKYYPQISDDEIFSDLMSLQRELIFVQHFTPTNKQVELEKKQMKINQLGRFGRFMRQMMGDLHDFSEGLQADDFSQINHAMNIVVLGENTDVIDSSINAISSSLAGKGINIKREEGYTEGAFWSMFPDYEPIQWPRTVELSSETCADFCTFSAKPFGNEKCSFGDHPVAMFKTTDGQNYNFTFHPTSQKYVAGSALIVGSSGSGKTLTTAFLISQCMKFLGHGDEGRFKGLIFDSLNGLKVPTKALDGNYVDIADEEGFIPLNPLQMPDNRTNRGFLEKWIEDLAGNVKDQERDKIIRAVRANYETLEPEERSLHNLRIAFGISEYDDKENPTVLKRLQEWLPNENDPTKSDYNYGMFFNGTEDALNFDKQLVGFDLTFLNDNPKLLVPLTSYLFHRFTDYINHNPCPHLWFIDEAFKFIENPIIYPHIRTALKEWRKRNGIVVAAIQELETLNSIDVGQEFLSSFHTYILFRDLTASPENYIGKEGRAGVGLNESEFNWIKSAPSGKREVMVKRKTGEFIILDVDLSVLGKHINLLRSEKEVISAYDNLKNEENWQELLMNSL